MTVEIKTNPTMTGQTTDKRRNEARNSITPMHKIKSKRRVAKVTSLSEKFLTKNLEKKILIPGRLNKTLRVINMLISINFCR